MPPTFHYTFYDSMRIPGNNRIGMEYYIKKNPENSMMLKFVLLISVYLNIKIFILKFQAKQRASVKWLLSKAYNHKTPEELREPFYKDHEVSHQHPFFL